MTQTVDTAKVTGRRKLHFNTLADIVADTEQLAAVGWKQLGNWSLGKICAHLGRSLDSAADDNQADPPWVIRWIGPLMKGRVLKKGLPPGFQMTKTMKPIFMPPDSVETDEGIDALKTATARFEAATLPKRSKFLGKMTRDDWVAFHCRHAEMHLSFIVPV